MKTQIIKIIKIIKVLHSYGAIIILPVTLLLGGCDRDPDAMTATLSVNNNFTKAAWSVYVAPSISPTERSMDLLGSVALEPGASRSFTINTCGQAIEIVARFSDGSERTVTSAAVVDCNTVYSCDIDNLGVMTCN